MDSPVPSGQSAVAFKSPKRFLAGLDPAMTAHLISSGVDIALVIDNGVIKDLAVSNRDLLREGYQTSWRGKAWRETVTVESQAKIDDLLAAENSASRWRQVNHPSSKGVDIPVNYTTVSAGKENVILALGRELRSVATLQQRLVKTHQELEREYARLRHSETRYRHLFNAMSDAVVIVDASDGTVQEINPAATALLQVKSGDVVNAPVLNLAARESAKAFDQVIERALAAGEAQTNGIKTADGIERHLSASAFQQDNAAYVIVRIVDEVATSRSAVDAAPPRLLEIIDRLPDGLVVTTSNLRVLSVNPAFLEMVQIVDERQTIGDQLSNWLGRSATELNMLVSNLKSYGVVRNFATVVRDRFGADAEVEVSAIAAPLEGDTAFGFAIRNTSRRLQSGADLGAELPNSVDEVTGLVGRLPLKEIVRESTDLIERLCIDAALEIADDNRASAAEILGLSRQGLYSKLKRFGIDDDK
ncbi:MAG: transcriptional regulator PpsR [Pseudomonadota bacterium]